MINDQITDSVTQIIKYKDGMGGGRPSKITFRYHNNSLYDDVINKFNNPNDFHIPNIDECKILHSYLGRIIMPKMYLTTESLDPDHVTLAYILDGWFTQSNRKDYQNILLVQIEYQPILKGSFKNLYWGNNKTGDYATAWNEADKGKSEGWRLPSVEELQEAASNKIPGFIDNQYYWSNDWHGDPSHAGSVQMYSGAYFIGMPCYNTLNYRLVKEI